MTGNQFPIFKWNPQVVPQQRYARIKAEPTTGLVVKLIAISGQ